MSAWMFIAAIASAAIGGAILGAVLAFRFNHSLERRWLKRRCGEAAQRIRLFVGTPVFLMGLHRRSAAGHDFTTDAKFLNGLRETLERVFRVGGTV